MGNREHMVELLEKEHSELLQTMKSVSEKPDVVDYIRLLEKIKENESSMQEFNIRVPIAEKVKRNEMPVQENNLKDRGNRVTTICGIPIWQNPIQEMRQLTRMFTATDLALIAADYQRVSDSSISTVGNAYARYFIQEDLITCIKKDSRPKYYQFKKIVKEFEMIEGVNSG